MTTESVLQIDSAQAMHLLSASGVTEREAKKATRCRSNKSVFPSELIKKAWVSVSTYPPLKAFAARLNE